MLDYLRAMNRRNETMTKLWNAFVNWMVKSGENSAAHFNKTGALYI